MQVGICGRMAIEINLPCSTPLVSREIQAAKLGKRVTLQLIEFYVAQLAEVICSGQENQSDIRKHLFDPKPFKAHWVSDLNPGLMR